MPSYESKEKLSVPIGTSGVDRAGGYVTVDPLKSLHGERGIRLYAEMSHNSSVISAIRYLVRTWITQVEWYVKPADESKKSKEVAQFIEECMHDMAISWVDFISDVLTFIDYGWAWFEWVAKVRRGDGNEDERKRSKYNDGKYGWEGLYLRGQNSWHEWKFDGDRLVGMVQNDPDSGNGPVLLDLSRSVHFRTENAGGNPEGRSLYRGAVVDWYSAKRVTEMELIGAERDFVGTPVATAPIDAFIVGTDAYEIVRPAVEKGLAQLQRNERLYLLFPAEVDGDGKATGWSFKLEASPGKHQFDTTKMKQQLNSGILMSVLAQFIMLGVASEYGSRSLGDSSTSNFSMSLGAILDNICQTFTRQAIGSLLELNQIPREYGPTLEHGDIETPSLEKIGNFVSKLSGAGLDFTDEATVKELRRFAELPTDVECGCGGGTEED